MKTFKSWVKRYFLGVPIVTIVFTSFMPMRVWAQQALVLFTLIWFYIFLLSDVFGK